jgi:two-component system, NarL family, sensor histidine kinase UhpB
MQRKRDCGGPAARKASCTIAGFMIRLAGMLLACKRSLLLAGLLFCGAAVAQTSAPAPIQRFADALAADDSGSARFPGDAVARAVALPDEWALSRPGADAPLWYRLRFDAPGARQSGAALGLLIERVCGNVMVQLNGQPLHAAGRVQDPIALDCEQPLLLPLPPAVLEDSANTIDLRLAGYALEQVASRQRAAALSAPLIGAYDALHALQRETVLMKAALPQLASSALLMMGLVIVVLGWWQHRERHLLYFGALSIAWAAVTLRPWWHGAGLGRFVTEAALVSLIGLVALLAIQFLLHFARRRSRHVAWLLVFQVLLVPLSLVLAGPQQVHAAASSWYLLFVIEALLAIGYFLHVARVAQRRDFWPILTLVLITAVMVGIELAGQRWLLPTLWRTLPHVATPLAFLGMGLLLVHQYGRALRSAEELRNSLESRIRDSSAAMERNYAQMAELRVEQVTQQERKRIAADLHDDLGAKLLTIVHTSESERISTLAREALEEMRLSVRGLTGKPVKLIDALGDWRAEVVGRLSQTGVEGEWQAPTDDLPQTLSARAYVQTTRILREAVSNIIKHSAASRCSIRCHIASGDFHLKIQDNGKGIPLELDGRLDRGHGMTSMKHRAKQLHGQCLVESGPGYGTVIRLTIPLEKHTLAA